MLEDPEAWNDLYFSSVCVCFDRLKSERSGGSLLESPSPK
jgi:hypothetical protein